MAQGYTGGNVTPPGTGQVVQVVNTNYTAYASLGSTAIPQDDTIPQITEGNAVASLSTAITCSNANNKVLVTAICFISNSSNAIPSNVCLFQDSGANAVAVASQLGNQGSMIEVVCRYYGTVGTTSATTFSVRVGGASGTYHINGTNDGAARLYGGAMISSVNIQEIKA